MILADGYEFKIERTTIMLSNAIKGKKLTIYGQTNQSGKLTVNNETAGDSAINLEGDNGTFVINGGIIDVTSNASAGKSAIYAYKSITINNGTLNAKGTIFASNNDITINGGTVTVTKNKTGLQASKGAININGGKVTDKYFSIIRRCHNRLE